MLEWQSGNLRKCPTSVVFGHFPAPGGNEISVAHGLRIFVSPFRNPVDDFFGHPLSDQNRFGICDCYRARADRTEIDSCPGHDTAIIGPNGSPNRQYREINRATAAQFPKGGTAARGI